MAGTPPGRVGVRPAEERWLSHIQRAKCGWHTAPARGGVRRAGERWLSHIQRARNVGGTPPARASAYDPPESGG
ncbi:hypothetical protein AAII07_03740 [Microvirga sp. 0TCS3.31]